MGDVGVCVVGAMGRMGRRVAEAAASMEGVQVRGALEMEGHPMVGEEMTPGVTVVADPGQALKGCQAYIDFTGPESSLAVAQIAGQMGVAAVIGTTGWTDGERENLEKYCEAIPWILAPNMSFGVAVVAQLVKDAAAILGPDYAIEVVETHHGRKADAPSGTALMLAEQACAGRGLVLEDVATHGRQGRVGARAENEVGIHAVRGGDVVGDHHILFLGPGERIELVHKADSRDTFAQGSVRAALFLQGREPRRYQIADVVMDRG